MNNKFLIFGLGLGTGIVLTLIYSSLNKGKATVENKGNQVQPNPKTDEKKSYPTAIYKGTSEANNMSSLGVGDTSKGFWKKTEKGEEWYMYSK